MKSFIKKHIPFLVMTSLLLLMIIFLIVLQVLKQNPTIAESWTRTFARSYTTEFGKLNENVPFSVTEVSFIVSIISCMVFLAWGACCIGERKVWAGINKFLMVTLVIVGTITMYSASVGMAYNRKPVELPTYKGEIKKEDFYKIATYYVDDLNKCAEQLDFDENGNAVMPYSRDTLIYKLRDEFSRLPQSDYYGKYVPRAKELATSGIFTAFGIVGIYFGVLGEANFSNYATTTEMPFYITHELAHGTGVMREDDAQLVATYLTLTSSDPYIRYSCYYNTLESMLSLLNHCDDPNAQKEVIDQISERIWKNYNYIYEHWKGKAFVAEIGDKINDWYLKSFGQKDGTTSYQDDQEKTDDSGKVITLSHYQSIYVKQYYDLNS